MKPLTPKEDPAFPLMTLDILGNILSRAEAPGDLGTYLTEEIRELTGALCVLLLQCRGQEVGVRPRVIGVNPQRRKAWAESPAAAEFFEAVKALTDIRIWRGSEPSETADYLRKEGFELTLAIPLNVGTTRVGAMLVLGMPDELYLASTVDLLRTLSTTLALVLRNAFLFEKQEEIIQERTAILQETNERLQIELIERKRAEESVVRSEQKYRELVENANSIIMRWSVDGTVTFLNEFGLRFFGYEESEIIDRPIVETIVPETESSGRNLVHLMDEILKNPREYERNINENRCRDGRRVWIAWTNKIVYDDQGRYKEILSIGSDITERKVAEARVERLTQLYAALSQCNQAIVRSSCVEELLPQICRDVVEFGGMQMAWIGMVEEATGMVRPVASFGRGTEYLEGIEVSVDAEQPSGRGPSGTAIRENQPVWCQDFQHDPSTSAWHKRSAHYGWASTASLPLCRRGKPIGSLVMYSDKVAAFDEDGRKLLVEMASDISFALDSYAREADRKQVEASLRGSEARFKSMFDEAPLGIAVVDSLNGRFYSVNPMFAKIAGRTVEEMLNIDWVSITHPDDIQEDLDNMALMNAGKINGFQMEKRYLRPDGYYVWINITVAPIYVEAKAHPRHLLMIEEITERKQMEDALRSSEARFRALYEKAPLGIARLDSFTGKFLQINTKYCEILDRPPGEMLERTFQSVTYPDDLALDLENMEKLRAGSIRFFEMDKRYLRPDDSIVWVNLTVVPEWAIGELPTCHIAMVADITERKRAEENLTKAKEAAETANQAKDQFIAVLSHELRTPLTPVLATVTAMNAENHLPPEVHANLEMIRQNVELEARLIDDLLDVTRIAKGKMELFQEPMDAHACLLTALEICHSEIEEKHLQLSLDLHAARHHVHGDATRLRQVFWNLLKNAAKFTAPGGLITIRTANVNERLIIEVADTGIGIEPDLLPQIFNQFKQGERTRARRFGGLGLGLSIAKAVVEMHQGILTAASEGQGRGATFTVALDAITPPLRSPSVVSASPPAAKKAEKQNILLVEDHPDTLRILSKLLQKWGYSVATAESVQDALALADTQPFDLLISDLGLPDGSGLEVMQHLKERYQLRGIAVSGFGTDEDIRQSRDAGFEEHLVKPISFEVLRNAVQRISN